MPKSILSALTEWQEKGWQPYLFGGVLRDLLILGRRQRPRDIDVVVAGESRQLDPDLAPNIRHKNRFGGFRLELSRWNVDVWQLEKTWAFQHNAHLLPQPENLPRTTFLNVEAVAVSIGHHGRAESIYEHNFFRAIQTKTIDINFEDNPYPALATVRALATAFRIQFTLSPNLARYILNAERSQGASGLIAAQETHYGYVRFRRSEIKSLIRFIGEKLSKDPNIPVSLLPLQGVQMSLW